MVKKWLLVVWHNTARGLLACFMVVSLASLMGLHDLNGRSGGYLILSIL